MTKTQPTGYHTTAGHNPALTKYTKHIQKNFYTKNLNIDKYPRLPTTYIMSYNFKLNIVTGEEQHFQFLLPG